jgi:hypothetical protein
MVMTMDIPTVDAYSGMELCMSIWLNHDYGDGRVVDISAVDAYSVVEVANIFSLGSKSFLIFFSKLKWTHPLTKLNIDKSCYMDNIWLW